MRSLLLPIVVNCAYLFLVAAGAGAAGVAGRLMNGTPLFHRLAPLTRWITSVSESHPTETDLEQPQEI